MGRAAIITRSRKNNPPISAAAIVKTGSAGTLPSQVRRKKTDTNIQKWSWRIGQRVVVGADPNVLERAGRAIKDAIAQTRTITPPSL